MIRPALRQRRVKEDELPYSIKEIYGIRTSGRYHFPEQIYHEFYQIYEDNTAETVF